MDRPAHGGSPPSRRYAGLDPEARASGRRNRLLEAGLSLFGTVGYADAGVPQLCRAAGVSPRHFYEAFGSKEALLRSVYDAIVTDAGARVVRAIEEAPQELECRVDAGLDAFLHAFLDDPRRVRINNVEVVGVSREMEHHRRGVREAFADLIQREAQALGDDRVERGHELRLISIALVGAINELLIHAATGERSIGAEDVLPVARRLVLRALDVETR